MNAFMVIALVLSLISILLSIEAIRITRRTKEQTEKNVIATRLLKERGIVIKTRDDLQSLRQTVNDEWRKEHGLPSKLYPLEQIDNDR